MTALAALLLLSLSCWAASPPPYAAEGTVKSLASAMAGAIAALDSVQTTTVEAPRAAKLKASIDALVVAASSAAVSAQELQALTAAPQKAMGGEDLDREVDALALRRQWKELGNLARPFRDELEGWEPPKKEDAASKAKARKQQMLKEGLGCLERADRALKLLEELAPKLSEARSAAKTEASLAQRAAWELGRAASELDKIDLAVLAASREAKAKIDALDEPPENEARTRVYQKLEPLIDAVRSISYQGDVARNRAATFAQRYAVCLKKLKVFADLAQEASARQGDAAAELAAAKEPLSRLKD